jgi:hypothetical protein
LLTHQIRIKNMLINQINQARLLYTGVAVAFFTHERPTPPLPMSSGSLEVRPSASRRRPSPCRQDRWRSGPVLSVAGASHRRPSPHRAGIVGRQVPSSPLQAPAGAAPSPRCGDRWMISELRWLTDSVCEPSGAGLFDLGWAVRCLWRGRSIDRLCHTRRTHTISIAGLLVQIGFS